MKRHILDVSLHSQVPRLCEKSFTGGKECLYMTGHFTPVDFETAYSARVSGQLPAELQGAFLQVGPNPSRDPEDQYHW